MNSWNPRKNAPTDGKHIITYSVKSEECHILKYNKILNAFTFIYSDDCVDFDYWLDFSQLPEFPIEKEDIKVYMEKISFESFSSNVNKITIIFQGFFRKVSYTSSFYVDVEDENFFENFRKIFGSPDITHITNKKAPVIIEIDKNSKELITLWDNNKIYKLDFDKEK